MILCKAGCRDAGYVAVREDAEVFDRKAQGQEAPQFWL